MNRLICVVGPTGTGKTNLAIKLHQQISSVLVSADSRQVYKGMDIVTGKDHPSSVNIFGIDLVLPNQNFSLASWRRAVMPHIAKAWQLNKTPIIVGGTGLYLKSLTQPLNTIYIPPNQKLRHQLNNLSVTQLQAHLLKLDKLKFDSLNRSDSLNPRRLIRAIEVSIFKSKHNYSPKTFTPPKTLYLGITPPKASIYLQQIRQRVISRLELGAIQETQALITQYSPTLNSFSSIGYRHIIDFLDHKITQAELIENWTKDELAYAKRQLTWFKKTKQIIWLNSPHKKFSSVASLVKDWYSSN